MQLTRLRIRDGKTTQRGDTRAWPSESQPFDERDRLGRGSADTFVRAVMRLKSRDAAYPVELVPSLQGPGGDPGLPGEDRERDLVFDMQPKNTPPLGRVTRVSESFSFPRRDLIMV